MVLAQVSTRNYEEVIGTISEGYGVKKSSVSRHGKAASARELKDLLERPLGELDLLVEMIDGIEFHGRAVLGALGIPRDGKKDVLGVWEGATENARVSEDLIEDLVERGLRSDRRLLFVLDGSKALSKALKATFGKAAEIQRSRIHKERNVLSYLPEGYHAAVRRPLRNAWGLKRYQDAKAALKAAVAYLRGLSDSAASSLEEGLEEPLTLHRLPVPDSATVVLRSTNSIENVFSRVRSHVRNVKNWTSEEMVERWAAAGLLRAERGFRRTQAYRDLQSLVVALRGELADEGAAA